jgi:hypothetical protein
MIKFTAVANNAGTDPKYQWKRNGKDVAGATAFTWSANNLSHNDTISCLVTSSTWCASPASHESNRVFVSIKLGIDEPGDAGGIRLYPNPNSGRFIVNIANNTKAQAEVFNAIGQVLYKLTLEKAGGNEVDLPQELPAGNYLLKLRTEGEVKAIRFSVNR